MVRYFLVLGFQNLQHFNEATSSCPTSAQPTMVAGENNKNFQNRAGSPSPR